MSPVDETLVLMGVPVAVLTTLVVEALKRAGLDSRWAPWSAVGTAMVLAALAELVVREAWLAPVARVVVAGLVLGLASSGSYSWARQLGRRSS
jgi:ABC-type iron transport system FetAB permease component